MASAPKPRAEGDASRGRRSVPSRAVAALAVLALLSGALALRVAASAPAFREQLRAEAARALTDRLPSARLEGDVRVDARLRVVVGPIVVPSPRAAAPPVVRVERAILEPRLGALLRGRVELSRATLQGVHLEPGARLEGLAAVVRDASRRERRTPEAPPGEADPGLELALSDVTATVPRAGAAPVELGPVRATLLLRRGAGATSVTYAVRTGRARVEGDARVVAAGGSFEAAFRARTSGVWLSARRLAPEPVGPFAFTASGVLRAEDAGRRIALERGVVELGRGSGAAVSVEASLDARAEPAFDVALRADALEWGALVAALPEMVQPPPGAPAVTGALAGALRVSGPLRRPSAWRVAIDLDASHLAPASEAAARLAAPFTYAAHLAGGRTRDVVVGPRNPAFVPLAALPRHVVRAVLASEDAGFFAHHGFDLGELQEALATAGARRRLRGASTITQQLAKNLYLSPERTLARKVREAFAAIALEASVPKRRLLEIYLNVAEWGDGVVGIGEAARHWFGKDARDLSPKEAAFLASVIPNPVRYEMYRRRGALTDAWEARVRDLLVKLRAADALTDAELRDAWDAPLVFAHG